MKTVRDFKMIWVAILIATVLFFVVGPVKAQRLTSFERDVVNNSIDTFVTCFVFYTTGKIGIERRNDNSDARLIKALKKNADVAFAVAMKIGMSIGLKPETLQIKLEEESQAQLTLTGASFVNFTILRQKYGNLCKQAVTNPAGVLDFWAKKIKSRRR